MSGPKPADKYDSLRGAITLDSDGDGLMNWEEVLWKTNQNNPDTDGDGAPDGEEVRLKRNPALAGPDDKLAEGDIPKALAEETGDDSVPPSEAFSQELFSNYVARLQMGEEVDEEDMNALINELLAKYYQEPIKRYSAKDITVIADNSTEALRKYGNEAGKILNRPLGNENELVITLSAMEGDNSQIKKLDGVISQYETALKDLLSVQTPSALAGGHISLAQAIHNIIGDVKKMRTIIDDPQNGMIGVSNYDKDTDAVADAIKNIGRQLLGRKATFGAGENGAVFTGSI